MRSNCGIEKIVVSTYEPSPKRVGRHQLLHGADHRRLVSVGIYASGDNRAHQYRYTVVCSCGKHHMPGESTTEGEQSGKGQKSGTLVDPSPSRPPTNETWIVPGFWLLSPLAPGGWLGIGVEALRDVSWVRGGRNGGGGHTKNNTQCSSRKVT
jgi:hypothetical protein